MEESTVLTHIRLESQLLDTNAHDITRVHVIHQLDRCHPVFTCRPFLPRTGEVYSSAVLQPFRIGFYISYLIMWCRYRAERVRHEEHVSSRNLFTLLHNGPFMGSGLVIKHSDSAHTTRYTMPQVRIVEYSIHKASKEEVREIRIRDALTSSSP